MIINILILFILVNSFLKLSFWKGWQAVVFGAVCGIFILAAYPYAILQSKTQIAASLGNPEILKNLAVIITLESAVCFGYCIMMLQEWSGVRQKWWAVPLKWYPSLLIFPVLFYLHTQLIFTFPGVGFSAISYLFAGSVVLVFPLLRYFFNRLLPEREMRLEVHFLVSLFVCIIGLLTTVNGNVTYRAVAEPLNWKAMGFAFGLFLLFFLAGMYWSRFKWIVLQKRSTGKRRRPVRNA